MMRALVFASCLSLSLCSILDAANAQENTPRTLAPRTLNPVEQTSPSTNTPTSPATLPTRPTQIKSLSDDILVQPLGRINQEALGVLSGDKGYGNAIWANSQQPFILSLINRLPAQHQTLHFAQMQRRLLLTTATPPSGTVQEGAFTESRVNKLFEMGYMADVIALINTVPRDVLTPSLLQKKAETFFLQADFANACALSSSEFKKTPRNFWAKSFAFCQVLAQQTDQAALSLSFLRENAEEDAVYITLMDALLANETAKIETLSSFEPLELAMINFNKSNIGNVDDLQSPLLLTLPAFNQSTKNKLIELGLGLSSIDDVSAHLASFTFSSNEKENTLETAPNLPNDKAQALLYQVTTQKDQLQVIKAETINLALDLATQNDIFTPVSVLYAPIIKEIDISADLLWFAPNAFKSQLAAGEWENAKAWYLFLRNAALSGNEITKEWQRIRPYAVLAGFDIAEDAINQSLKQWSDLQDPSQNNTPQTDLLYALVAALGHPIQDTLWLDLINASSANAIEPVNPALLINFKLALAQEKTGQALLVLFNAVKNADKTKQDQSFIYECVKGLNDLSLENDARLLAVEIALNAKI